MASFESVLSAHFPKAMPQNDFVKRSYDLLQGEGFRAENTIAFVSVCRDELTLPFVEEVKKNLGRGLYFFKSGRHALSGKDRVFSGAAPCAK